MYELRTHGGIENPNFVRIELLLHPNIPKPLHGTNPRTILGDTWWNEQRQIAYTKNNYCCWACGIHKSEAKYHQWLEAHESYKINYEKGEVELIEIVALCHSCHNYIHSGRMQMLIEEKKMEKEKEINILIHGDKLIQNAELKHKERPNKVAKWKDWNLLLNGERYYSKFQDIYEWAEFYSEKK